LALVGLDNLLDFGDVLLLLLNFGVVLLDTVHKTLTCLWEWEIHFVGLKFQIFFALYKLSLLIAQVLGTLLQSVSSQTLLRVAESRVDFLKLASLVLNICEQLVIVVFVLFVVIALFWVQIVQFSLICKVNFLNLLLVRMNFIFHVPLLREEPVQVRALSIVLILNVHVQSFNVVGLRV